MKRKIAKILACSMAIILTVSGMQEGFLYKAEGSEKEHKAYAAVTGYITSYDDLVEAAATGGIYVLSNSVVLTKTVVIPEGVELTLLQENGMSNKITSVEYANDLLRVSNGASLTLGSKDTDAILVDGSHLFESIPLITVDGTLTIENADITCEKGVGVGVSGSGKLYMNQGYIHDCKYEGIWIWGDGCVIAGGTISNCKYSGICVGTTVSDCKITGGTISDVTYYGIKCEGGCTITGGLVTGCGYGIYAGSNAAFTMNGGVVTECDYGIYTDGYEESSVTMSGGILTECEYSIYTYSSHSSVTMNGGMVANSKSYALYPRKGAIYLTGGNIQNGRCTTYSEGSFYIGGTPCFDDNSFLLVREGAPVIQMGNLSAPVTNSFAKINVYGMTTQQPLIIPLSEEVSLENSMALYMPYDRDYSLSIREDGIYMEGTKEIATNSYPTVGPASSDITETEAPFISTTIEAMTPVPTEMLPVTTAPSVTRTPLAETTPSATKILVPDQTSQIEITGEELPIQTSEIVRPVSSDTAQTERPFISATVETMAPVHTEMPLLTQVPPVTKTPLVETVPPATKMPTQGQVWQIATTTEEPPIQTYAVTESTQAPTLEPVATPNVYETFTFCRPEITKITAKGLKFRLQWKFVGAVPAKQYAIYCSSDQKKYSLVKTVDAPITTVSVPVPKAYTGKKMYFYVVAETRDVVSGKLYQSDKSYVASKYLINKVTGTKGSYHTGTQRLIVKWKKVSNCTGYSVYIKAKCNGKTMTKRCATVSKKKNSVSITIQKMKRKFASNGKPIRIKKYSVRAFYKSGKKIAYSPS